MVVKVIAVYQFYFPYVLPRGEDWSSQPFGVDLGRFVVGIHPRTSDELLFPDAIDKTLSSMELHLERVEPPTSRMRTSVADRALDRIQVRVDSDLSSTDEAQQSKVQDQFLEAAIRACNLFLEHCRIIARSPFVTGVERHYHLKTQRYIVLTPYTVTWFEGEKGKGLPVYPGNVNGQASSGAIASPERGTASMQAIFESMQRSREPSLPLALLLDAEAAVRTLRIREAIIALASACEVSSDQYLQRLGKIDDSGVERILSKRISFAEKRFHRITDYLSGRSLQREIPHVYRRIENLYRTRNKVAHEGRAYFEEGGQTINVDQELTATFLEAAEKTIPWIGGIA